MKFCFIFLIFLVIAAFISCSPPVQHSTYSIIGSWKLVGIQLEGSEEKPITEDSVSQNITRFIYEESGAFKLMLNTDGRGLQGGYLYNPDNNILSIRYGAQIDTALVHWVNSNRMIHTTIDGKTKTVLERETNLPLQNKKSARSSSN